MKNPQSSLLSERYLTALQNYLQQGAMSSLEEARELGEQAVAQGLETYDLAGIHKQTLTALGMPDGLSVTYDDMVMRAAVFFTEAITPIEETHSFALEADEDLHQLKMTLEKRTLALSDSKRELQAEMLGRMKVEAEFKSCEARSAQLLTESRLMEKHLQEMIRRILSANEEERKKMSHQLHDEIAQTLLGINVRLLKLKKEAGVNKVAVDKEIATIQKLVKESVNVINRLAHEFGSPHEA